jgi:AraC-like DNA-binding protein
MEKPSSAVEDIREVGVRRAANKLTPAQRQEAVSQATTHSRRASGKGTALGNQKYRAAFLEEAARAAGDDCFGLNLARQTDPRERGIIYYVIAASATALDAIRNLVRYNRTVNSAEAISLEETARQVVIERNAVAGLKGFERHIVEWDDAVLIATLRDLTGVHIVPLSAAFDHQRTLSVDEFAKFFGCAVRFGANRHRLVFPRNVLDAPIRTADPYLLKLLKKFCEEALHRRGAPSTPTRAKAEKALVELLPHGKATVGTVAKALAMSSRTLARRLADEGTSYAALLDELRRDLAMRHLEDENLELSQIAWLLWYSHVTSFSHAFRRWTSSSPKTVRARVWDRQASVALPPG